MILQIRHSLFLVCCIYCLCVFERKVKIPCPSISIIKEMVLGDFTTKSYIYFYQKGKDFFISLFIVTKVVTIKGVVLILSFLS